MKDAELKRVDMGFRSRSVMSSVRTVLKLTMCDMIRSASKNQYVFIEVIVVAFGHHKPDAR